MERDLAQVEAAAYRRAALQDGLIDILCGLCLAGWGILVTADQVVLGALLFSCVLPMSTVLRRRIVRPRLGHVRLKEPVRRARKSALAGVLALALVAGIAVFAAGQGEPRPDWLARFRELGDLNVGLLLAFLATTIGFTWSVPRAHAYAVVIVGSFLLGRVALAPDHPWTLVLPLLVAGAVVTGTGLALLARFLRRHPRKEPPEGLLDTSS